MIRTVLVATTLALGISLAFAADPIKDRQELMKQNGASAKLGGQFMKGEVPFDLEKAKGIFASYAETSAKMPALFPPDSKTGGDTEALPVIWEKMDDFKAKFSKFEADAKEAQANVKDEASFKALFPTVQKNCGGCHETYRKKKS
jgi:cytochrome c556